MNHTAEYFENLYQAREANPQYDQHTKEVLETAEEIKDSLKNRREKPFTLKELDTVIRALKRKKTPGPDDLPNEILIEATQETKKALLTAFNNINTTTIIPKQWTQGTIKTLYKGKGQRGMCSNQRGITLSSNMGKVYERLINNRIKESIEITEAQAGGKKGVATVDHILVLKETIKDNQKNKKPTYLTFLDVTKAYDKAWIQGIMHIMYKRGLTGPTWTLTNNLNTNLTARIQTKHGLTREIQIKDSIKQGGVLSVTQYAVLMDEINKTIEANIRTENNTENQQTQCLLWVDDVAIISNNPETHKKLLNITQEVANKYRIEFGKNKSKTILIGKGEKKPFKINEMDLEYTETYKYLGEIMNHKANLDDHINDLDKKAEAAYQTIIQTTNDANFKGIEMEVIWKLVETCIIPIITYGAETWQPTKQQMKKINTILDNIIKRILRVPNATPRENIYLETRIPDAETIMKRKRLNYYKKIIDTKTQPNLKKTLQTTNPKAWAESARKNLEELGLTQNSEEIAQKTKAQWNKMIKDATTEEIMKNIKITANTKSKTRFLHHRMTHNNNQPQPYILKLTRNQTSTIFKARNRMIRIKENYKNEHDNMECRGCGHKQETLIHVMNTCTAIHTNNTHKIHINELFKENINIMREIAKKLTHIDEIIDQWNKPTRNNTTHTP